MQPHMSTVVMIATNERGGSAKPLQGAHWLLYTECANCHHRNDGGCGGALLLGHDKRIAR